MLSTLAVISCPMYRAYNLGNAAGLGINSLRTDSVNDYICDVTINCNRCFNKIESLCKNAESQICPNLMNMLFLPQSSGRLIKVELSVFRCKCLLCVGLERSIELSV